MPRRPGRRSPIFAVIGLCLFGCAWHQVFGSVMTYEVVKSGQHSRIVTEIDGQPLTDFIVEVYDDFGPRGEPPAPKPRLILKSDSHGEAVLPKLPHGQYFIRVRSKPNFVGFLRLKIPRWELIQPHKMTMHLFQAAPSFEEKLAALEALTNIETVTTFRGMVCDSNGDPLPNSTLKVLARGTEGKQSVAELKTDKDGRFYAILPEGRYVVLVRSPGFVSSLLPVAISASGVNEEIQIKLEDFFAT